LVTISGTDLSTPTNLQIGGVTAIVVSATVTQTVAMVMPGSATGVVSLTTAGGTFTTTTNFTITPSYALALQQGAKLVGTGNTGAANQGWSVSLSADGNTAIVGGNEDNFGQGAVWIYVRSGGSWVQQGAKLVGTGGSALAEQGFSVALSADGNTAIVGGWVDNSSQGAVWIFVRTGGSWAQQGTKLVGTGNIGFAAQGSSVSLSADGNTAIVGGYGDNGAHGAVWIYARSGGSWAQQGAKLVGTGSVGVAEQGFSVSLSANGNTAIVGGDADNGQGAAWIYVRSGGSWVQQGAKLVGTGNTGAARQGVSVSLSADGNTAMVGGSSDNGSQGAAWIYVRSGGSWVQQGAKLVGTGSAGIAYQGISVSLSADGNTAVVGGYFDNTLQGAAWIYVSPPLITVSGTLTPFSSTVANTSSAQSIIVNGVVLSADISVTAPTGYELSLSSGTGYSNNISLVAGGGTVTNTTVYIRLVSTVAGGVYTGVIAAASANAVTQNFTVTGTVTAPVPVISSFTSLSGSVGSLVTINGTGLLYPNPLQIGGTTAIVVSGTATQVVAMVMPGSATGVVSLTTAGGTFTTTTNFTMTPSYAPALQQGAKLVGTGNTGAAIQGFSVSLSADGNTAIVGGYNDHSGLGAAWIYVRSSGSWVQQGAKLEGTGSSTLGFSVALSADGNTAIVGGYGDNGSQGAAWIYVRTGVSWAQQGAKLVGTGNAGSAEQGRSVSLSADGNTAIVGGYGDNGSQGAAWIYVRNVGSWVQQGPKLVGTGSVGVVEQGRSVSLSADGNTAIVGGEADNGGQGAAWIYVRSGGSWVQQGAKLVGTGNTGAARQGASVSLSADGNTAIVGGEADNGGQGAAWIYVRSGGSWAQQGTKLVGTGNTGAANQGISASLSADGNTAIVGGWLDNSSQGAAWIYMRSGSIWVQQSTKLVGTGSTGTGARQGISVSLSADGNTAAVGGYFDNTLQGAAWVYTPQPLISVSGSLNPFSSTVANTSSAQSIIVSGGGLLADISITAPTGYELSLSSGTGYSNNISLAAGAATVTNTPVYIRLVSTVAAGVYTGMIAAASANAVTQNFTVTGTVTAPVPVISSFASLSGPVGSLVTINGTGLLYPTNLQIGGVTAIVVSATATQTVAMVMPGSATGVVSLTTAGGTFTTTTNFTITPSYTPVLQQGNKLVGTGNTGAAQQGYSVSLSADGNTAIVGGYEDNGDQGAIWIYVRSGGNWVQQGSKLVGTGNTGAAQQGYSVSLSADGNTAIVGGYQDNSNQGAAWIFVRTSGSWVQQGAKLIGTGNSGVARQGYSVSLSADGNTAIVGGYTDNSNLGAAWIYVRTGVAWAQQGAKLVGTGNTGSAEQGGSVSLSADGNTAIVGGQRNNSDEGAAWIYVRSGVSWVQQGAKLVGTGNTGSAEQGCSVSLSADGNMAIVGGSSDNSFQGAAWVYVRSAGSWVQQGSKLVATGNTGTASQGRSVSLSADGNTAIVGGPDNNSSQGAAWLFRRTAGTWAQGSKLVGTGITGIASQGRSVSLSADGNTAVVGGYFDNTLQGAAWVFVPLPLISVSGSLTALTTCFSTASAAQSFTVSGANMQANLAVTAPAGYELSLSAGTGYTTSTFSLAPTGGAITNTTIYIRLSATAASGTYTGTISCTSANAVTKNLSPTGTINALPSTPTISAGSSTIFCSGGSVVLTSDAANGNKWYVNGSPINGAINTGYTASTAGSYSVQVTDGNSCSSAASIPVAVTVNALPSTPTINAGSSTTFCAGGSVVLTSNASSENNWYLNGSPINGATNAGYTASTAGSYSVRVMDGNSCSSAASIPVAVTVNALPLTPTASAGGVTTFCSGDSVVLTSNASSGNKWYLNGSPINGATKAGYKASAAGSYSVQITDGNSCSSAASIPVALTVNALPLTPTVSAGGVTTFCSGDSVVLTSNASSGNNWYLNGSAVSGAINADYTITATGNYSVRVTDGNSCTSAASIPIAVTVNALPSTPTISAGNATTFCSGGSVVLTSDTASGNNWYLNGSAVSGAINADYTITATGNYSVRVTDGNSCTSAASIPIAVTVNALPSTPTISAGNATTFCSGGSVVLTSDTASGNNWYLNGSAVSGAINADYTITATGNYSVRVTDGNSCTSAASIATEVTVNPLPSTPTITASGPTTFTNGGSVVFSSNAVNGNQWLLNGSPINGASAISYTATTSGNYSIRVIDGNSCSSTDATDITVTVNNVLPIPTINTTGTTTFCYGGSVLLTSSASSDNQWLLNNAPVNGATGNSYTATAAGSYSVRLADAKNNTSANATAVVVTVNVLPTIPVITAGGSTTICAGNSVVLSSSANSGNQWLLGGSPINGATSQTYSATANGNYSLRVSNANNCTSTAATATIVTVNALPSGTISQTSLRAGVVAGFTLTAPAGSAYTWGTGENTASIKAQATGNYSVTVTNTLGCQNLFTTQVILPSSGDVEKISIPNTFSPNGDGINDYWTIPELKNYPLVKVTIVNRNGSVVYQNNNTVPRWDGKYNGKDLPAGVYFYTVQPVPGLALKTGWVNLVR